MSTLSGTHSQCQNSGGSTPQFSLQFKCVGTLCSKVDGSLGTQCTHTGDDWTCTNNVICDGISKMVSKFEYSLDNTGIVSQKHDFDLPGQNCGFSVIDNNGTATFPDSAKPCPGMTDSSGVKTVTKTANGASLLATSTKSSVAATSSSLTKPGTTSVGASSSSTPTSNSNTASRTSTSLSTVLLCTILVLALLLGPATANIDFLRTQKEPGTSLLPNHPEMLSQLSALKAKREDDPEWCHGNKHCIEMEKILGFVVDYFTDKGKDAINGEDWIPDDFVAEILEQTCSTLLDEGFSKIGEKVGLGEVEKAMKLVCKPFVLDCVLTIDTFGAAALIEAPFLAIPALLGSTVLCDSLLSWFIDTVFEEAGGKLKDDFVEWICKEKKVESSSLSLSLPTSITTIPATSVSHESTSIPVTTSSELRSTMTPQSEPGTTTDSAHSIDLTVSPSSKGSSATPISDANTVTKVSSQQASAPSNQPGTTTAITKQSTSSKTSPSASSTASGVSIKALSGWTLDFPDLLYWENDISSYLDEHDLFLRVNGVRTVNTKCVGGSDIQVAGIPITITKGSQWVFETQKEPNPDTCCVRLYSSATCTGTKISQCVGGTFPSVDINVASWEIYNCQGIWTGQPV